MALHVAEVEYEHREILLKDKPRLMLDESPKGTVPVLVLDDGEVIDESIDIMRWALARRDPETWLPQGDAETCATAAWLEWNVDFKPMLDRYKYAKRHAEKTPEQHREACRPMLSRLNQALTESTYLLGQSPRLADFALFPFVRQFHFVDVSLLQSWAMDATFGWLSGFLDSPRFAEVMAKHPLWNGG